MTDPLSARVRTALAHEPTLREVSMFGGLAFMVNDRMLVAVDREGALLVRVDPGRNHELLDRPGARPAEMGAGRSMGPSWIQVSAASVASDDALAFWLGAAYEHHAGSQPAS